MEDDFESEIKKALQLEPVLNIAGRKMLSPPVFVKIDRYRELLEDVQKMRSYSLGLRDALDAMAELEKEFKTAMSITNKVLDKLNILISSLDMKLLKKPGETPEESMSSIKPPPEIEGYVKNIYEQIERLKGELQSLS
jgi:hypothetical protein